MKPTPQLAEAFVNLRDNRHFAVVLEAMREHETEMTQACTDYEGIALHRAQGAAKTLELWRKTFESAPALLEKFKPK